MKLTLQQINLAMKSYTDLQELLLNASLTFKIDDNYELLKRKNDLFVTKVVQINNKYPDNKDEFEKRVHELMMHEVDIPIQTLGTISEFKSVVLSDPSNKLRPNTLNLIRFMFDSAESGDATNDDCEI